jgi:hypothetical protein
MVANQMQLKELSHAREAGPGFQPTPPAVPPGTMQAGPHPAILWAPKPWVLQPAISAVRSQFLSQISLSAVGKFSADPTK